MIDKNLKSHLIGIMESEKKESESYFAYLRYISTISVGLLGLLIGLKPEALPNQPSKILFLATITLIALGIFFLSICLFYETKRIRLEIQTRKKQIKDYIDMEKKDSIQIDHIENDNLKVFERITFLLFTLSIITLVSYVCFSIL